MRREVNREKKFRQIVKDQGFANGCLHGSNIQATVVWIIEQISFVVSVKS